MATEHFRPDQPPEYHSFSGQGFTLHANADVLRTLDMLVREGAQAIPGIEIGGLLLGSDTSDLRLDAAHGVAIEHRFGPSYELSDGDIELIWQAISRVRQPSGPQIIGHFRSCATGELEVTAADLTIAALTGAPQPWMLLITASLSEPSLARLYSNPGGEFVELLAFTLAPAIPEGRTISPLEAPPEHPASQPAATHGHWRTALIAAGLLLACTALVTYFRPHEPPLDHYTGRHTDKTVTTVA